jgi:peptide/nickel transport system ATP-binding protein
MSEPVLCVRNLSVVFGRGSRVVDDLSFDIAAGEIVALVGESGAGKSTIGRALQGLLPAESHPVVTGSIIVDGVEIVGASPVSLRQARRFRIRAVPQDPMASLDPTMPIRAQMAESADGASVIDWLRRVGLTDPERIARSYPHRLSGGQRQRVLIAMAMMASPKLLIADEPTTALDVTVQAQILDMLRSLARERQAAVLLITHDLAVAASMASRVLVLHEGRIVETGSIREVVTAPAHAYTRRLIASHFDLGSDRTRPLGGASPTWVELWPEHRPRADEVVLNLTGVSKSFASGARTPWGKHNLRPVLRSIDLTIGKGECVALVGESGAGKSTVLRIAAGLIRPDSGSVTRTDEAPPQIVHQDAGLSLTPWLSIGEQIADRLRPLRLTRQEHDERLRAVMALVGLDPDLSRALPGELSGGQAQRAVIARAIIVAPKLLLCDEPITALDVNLAAAMLDLLGAMRRRLGMAVLFVTHNLAAARIIADRIVVLNDGELIEQGEPDTLIDAPKMAYTRQLIASVPRLERARPS